MKWLTLTEIGRRARSKKGALEVSYEIWNQRYQVTAKEYRQVLEEKKIDLGCDYCGLCRRYWPNCYKCPLGESGVSCTNNSSLYRIAEKTENEWQKHPTAKKWWVRKRAAKVLRDKLKELIPKPKKKPA